ncbi:amino acid transporter, putative [Talaromyces stipitatus ATCC 10500]|uniref:Amino acid transporter, putative n=1 Tax=Talaromyces stipitatus (strain ATCC 10500 / CBS 375.48 / QM 6759 / NRRL 1006) TaxID=441959 RepID=B8M0E5_TALSN|nr:amino acid transporter, putative [Talaromyces stipitatus ATCC 10500]EED21242.1 amino acid transporter, putative [Talaromyces stipitatus ATCC 10500]
MSKTKHIMMEEPKGFDSSYHNAPDMETGTESPVEAPVGAMGEIRRDLKSRHINMIAIAGMIGTGLFLRSGSVIATAGPAGAFIAYIIMGLVTAGVSYTTGEITSFMPSTGGFVRHATKFVEPALGAATGWNFWYTMSISVPAEISAAATVIQFWNSSINPAVWISVFLVLIVLLNLCGVRFYGESEVVFASLKILLIIGLIIGGLVIDLGGAPNRDRIGFRYWNDPGAFNTYIDKGATGRFLAIWSVLISAAFSYGNIQVVAISGSETQNPREIIPAATRKTFFRVFFFYVLSIFIVGLVVPYDDPKLQLSTGTAQQSPFVIAFQRSGVSVVPSIINAVVCTSAFSSGSACIFIASRTLYGLSRDGHAPKFFQKCNRFGVPHYAVGLTCVLLPLVYLNVGQNTSVVFGWFVNITTVAGLIGWMVIEITYLRFYYGLKAQGIPRDELPYHGPLQPYNAWATLIMVFLVVFFSGFEVFVRDNFTASGFLTRYLNVFIFIALYVFFKLWFKSKVIPLSELDFQTELQSIREEEHCQQHKNELEARIIPIFGISRPRWKSQGDRVPYIWPITSFTASPPFLQGTSTKRNAYNY